MAALSGLEADSTLVNKAAAQTRSNAMQRRRDRTQAWAPAQHRASLDANKLAVHETQQALLTNQQQSKVFKAAVDYLKSTIGAELGCPCPLHSLLVSVTSLLAEHVV